MTHQEYMRELIIHWNNQFPLDRVYRKKYNIAFGSPEHRAISQIDVYLDWLEDEVYKQHLDNIKEEERKEKEYREGKWIGERAVSEERAWELFDNLDVLDFSSTSNEITEE